MLQLIYQTIINPKLLLTKSYLCIFHNVSLRYDITN